MDGDSLIVARRRWFNFIMKPKRFAVRLYAIDAPELSQPYGSEARDAMRNMARGALRLDAVNNDRYGRVVGVVYRRNRKKSLNHMMVEAGLAYSYQRYGRLDGIEKAEARARKRRLGVWKSAQTQVRPWDYRRNSNLTSGKKGRWRLRMVFVLAVLAAVAIGLQWFWQSWGETLRAMLGI